MNRRSDQYWIDRFAMIENAQHATTGKTVAKMAREFAKAETEIDKDITRWFERLADNRGVSLAEARKLLDNAELEEFKWTVEEYIKLGRANGLQYDPKLGKMLENASAKVHIQRLEAEKLRMRMHLQKAFANEQVSMDELLHEGYKETFWRGAYEIQHGTGVGWQLEPLDTTRIDMVLNKPWTPDGRTFSDRIWGNQQQLVASLETKLTQALIRGDGSRSFITDLAKEMGVARHRAEALARTEMAYVGTVAQLDCFDKLELEKYRISATLDHLTSEICQGMDGKVFLMSEAVPGVTAPPFHTRCRTGITTQFDDMWGTRVAKGVDGKTYRVPRDMTYPEWLEEQKAQYGAERVEAAQKMAKNEGADKKQLKHYKRIVGKNYATNDLAAFQEMKYLRPDDYRLLKVDVARRERLAREPALALPNAGKVTAADAKFGEYLFGGNNPDGAAKGVAFESRLGYNKDNWQQLQKEITRTASQYPSRYRSSNEFGDSYEQKIVLYGLKGKPANVIVGWKTKDGKTWMTSAYIKELE